MRRLTTLCTFLLAVLLSLASLPGGLAAQADAGGIAGGLFTGLAPIATTLLTSGLMWVANSATQWMASWSNLAKYAALGTIGVLVSVLLGAIGGTVSADPSTWTAATAQGVAGAVVSALIYKLGQGR